MYNYNVRNLFKIVFLAILVCDVCTKMFTIFFWNRHYLNILKNIIYKKFYRNIL